MADKTWPSTPSRAFAPRVFSEGLVHDVDITIARSRRIYTRGLPGASWRAQLSFERAPVSLLRERRELVAFLTSLRGGADRLVLHNLLAPLPMGPFGGAPVLAASAAKGARSVQISGALPRPALTPYGGFEAGAGDLADGWAAFVAGSSGTVSRDRVAGASGLYQRNFSTALGASSADRMGVRLLAAVPVTPGQTYTWAADVLTLHAAGEVGMYVQWNLGAAYVSESASYVSMPAGQWQRRSVTSVAPPGVDQAFLYVWKQAGNGGANTLFLDNAQFSLGTSAVHLGPAALWSGDRVQFGAGGPRVMVMGDTLANDAGTLTLAFEPGLPAALSSGTQVIWERPSSRYVLASPLPLDAIEGDQLSAFSVDLVEDPPA